MFSNTILTIQLQKVSEKSETMMRVTGLDLVESAYNIEEPQPKRIQTLKGFLADFEGSSENDRRLSIQGGFTKKSSICSKLCL